MTTRIFPGYKMVAIAPGIACSHTNLQGRRTTVSYFVHLFLKAKIFFPSCLSPDFALDLIIQIWMTLLNHYLGPGKRTLLNDWMRPGILVSMKLDGKKKYISIFISL